MARFTNAFLLLLLAVFNYGFTSVSARAVESRQATNSTASRIAGPIAAAWYPSWLSSKLPVSDIPWSKYNAVTFSFATTTADAGVLDLDSSSQALLPTFVEEAKKHNVSAMVSLGGWGGSIYFSSAVATPESRARFTNAVLDLATKYNLDGIDFDWEHPNKQGIGCNQISSSDTANFLALLQQIRQDPRGSNLILSAAVALSPFAGPDGQPSTNLAGFAKELDFIAIMAYDVWGAWSTNGVGPNAPLDDSCATYKGGSAMKSVDDWAATGFPLSKIILGVASYGRAYIIDSNEASKLGNFPAFTSIPMGESDTGRPSVDQCGVTSSANSGIFNFNGLVEAGYLTANGTAAPGYTYEFDTCSKTPFLYDPKTQIAVSYDDPTSLAAKAEYIRDKGLGGFAMWQIAGDSNDVLVDALHGVLG